MRREDALRAGLCRRDGRRHRRARGDELRAGVQAVAELHRRSCEQPVHPAAPLDTD